jgi:hypothetical protein
MHDSNTLLKFKMGHASGKPEVVLNAVQYVGVGPFLVKLADDRGEVKAKSTDYIVYQGVDAVAVLPADLFTSLRAEDDVVLEHHNIPTGAHIKTVVKNSKGVAIPNQRVVLRDGTGAILTTTTSNEKGEVEFNVIPGDYAVQAVNDKNEGIYPAEVHLVKQEDLVKAASHKPSIKEKVQELTRPTNPKASDETPAHPITGQGAGLPASKDDAANQTANAPTTQRFNVMGQPDANGQYDSKGNLIK